MQEQREVQTKRWYKESVGQLKTEDMQSSPEREARSSQDDVGLLWCISATFHFNLKEKLKRRGKWHTRCKP